MSLSGVFRDINVNKLDNIISDWGSENSWESDFFYFSEGFG